MPAGVGALGSERAARGDDGEPEHATPVRELVLPAGLAGCAGQRVLPGLAVKIGDLASRCVDILSRTVTGVGWKLARK